MGRVARERALPTRAQTGAPYGRRRGAAARGRQELAEGADDVGGSECGEFGRIAPGPRSRERLGGHADMAARLIRLIRIDCHCESHRWRLSRAAGWIMMLMRWKGGWKGTCCVISRRGTWRVGQGKTRRGLWEEEQNPDRIGAWTDSSEMRAARLGGNLVQRRRWPSPDWWRALGVRDVRTIEESRRAGCSQGSRGEGGIERELKPELSR